jgi:hypothetical protein
MADMDAKGRRRKGEPRRGEKSNNAKLTAEQALTIFRSTASGQVLAKQFGVSLNAIRLIRIGKNWAHVTGGAK